MEILLDRAHFSCGQIDGRYSQNLKNAIEAYQSANQLKVDGVVGRSMWKLLNQDSAEAVIEHRISREDLAGPFVNKIPQDMEAKSKLKGMYYESPLQEFTGKYHASAALLKRLNPGQSFDRVGQEILVPNVETPTPGRAASVVVTGLDTKDPIRAASVEALDSAGKVLFYAPANIGGAHDPLPVGDGRSRMSCTTPGTITTPISSGTRRTRIRRRRSLPGPTVRWDWCGSGSASRITECMAPRIPS